MTALIRCRPHGKGILDRNKGGLVLWLNDQMKSSSVWSDMSGRDNHGGVYGAGTPPPATPGALGYIFDGVDDYVDAGNNASLNITNAITIEVWIKPTYTMNYPMIAAKGSALTTTLHYEYALSGITQRPSLLTQNHNTWAETANTSVPLNVWSHIAVTYNGSVLQYYLNGIPDGNYFMTGNMTATAYNLLIGKRDDGYPFNGSIDEVRIYNRALSASEISRLFQSTRGKFGV